MYNAAADLWDHIRQYVEDFIGTERYTVIIFCLALIAITSLILFVYSIPETNLGKRLFCCSGGMCADNQAVNELTEEEDLTNDSKTRRMSNVAQEQSKKLKKELKNLIVKQDKDNLNDYLKKYQEVRLDDDMETEMET